MICGFVFVLAEILASVIFCTIFEFQCNLYFRLSFDVITVILAIYGRLKVVYSKSLCHQLHVAICFVLFFKRKRYYMFGHIFSIYSKITYSSIKWQSIIDMIDEHLQEELPQRTLLKSLILSILDLLLVVYVLIGNEVQLEKKIVYLQFISIETFFLTVAVSYAIYGCCRKTDDGMIEMQDILSYHSSRLPDHFESI